MIGTSGTGPAAANWYMQGARLRGPIAKEMGPSVAMAVCELNELELQLLPHIRLTRAGHLLASAAGRVEEV